MPHECDSDRRRTVLGATFAPLKEDALSVRAARALEATTRGARTAEGAMMAAIIACIEHGLVRARCRSKTGNKRYLRLAASNRCHGGHPIRLAQGI